MGVSYSLLGFCIGHITGVSNTNLILSEYLVIFFLNMFKLFNSLKPLNYTGEWQLDWFINVMLRLHCNVIFGLNFALLLSSTGACYFIFRRVERLQKEVTPKANLNENLET